MALLTAEMFKVRECHFGRQKSWFTPSFARIFQSNRTVPAVIQQLKRKYSFDLTTTKNRGRLKRFETDPNKSWRWIVAFLDWFRVFLFNSSSELNIRHCSKAVFRDCKDTFYPRYEQCDQRLPGRGCQGESARTFILLCKILVAADESSKMKQICTARKTKSFE